MYDDELEYHGSRIILGGPLADMSKVFSGTGYVREGYFQTKYTAEEMMGKFRTASRDKILARASARQSQNSNSRCLTFAALPKGQNVEFFKVTKKVHNLAIIGYVTSDPKHPDNVDGDLPPGTLWPSRTYYVHNNVGPDEGAVICPAGTWGERCPICEYAKQRRKEGDATKEELQALRPKQRQLFNVIDLDSDDQEIKLLDMSYFLFGKTLDKELKDADDETVVDFYMPDGCNIRARFEKKSFGGREFWECDRVDFKERKKPYKDSIIDKALPLDDLLNHMEYKQLEELFVLGGDASTGDADDDGEERLERRREKESRGRRRDDDEDDEPRSPRRGSEDNGDDDDEPDEPKPRGRGSRRDPEPDDKDEGEDDTPPARGRGRKRDPEPEDDEPDEPKESRRAGRRRDPEPDDDDEEQEAPRGRRGGRKDSDDEEEAPRGRGRRKSEPEPDDEEDEEPKPRGRGRRQEPDDDEEDDPKPRGKSGKGDGKKVCPHGMKFGTDCDKLEECDECKLWNACNAALRA